MPSPLSNDLRKRILDSISNDGLSCKAAARHYKVSASTAIKLKQHIDKYKTHEPLKFGGYLRHKLSKHHDTVLEILSKQPDMTLSEICNALKEKGIYSTRMGIHRYLIHIGYSLKKRRCSQQNKTEKPCNTADNNGQNIKKT